MQGTYSHNWSYWERKHFSEYDIVIIGAGISGLFSAYFLKKRFPQKRIIIVEKDWISCGASTRNAGFACMGSLSELEMNLVDKDIKDIVSLFHQRKNGLELMRSILGDSAINYKSEGSYELLFEHTVNISERIDYWNEALFADLKCNAFSIVDKNNFPFAHVELMIQNNCEGSIDSGALIKNLMSLVVENDVGIFPNSKVLAVENDYFGKKIFLHDREIKAQQVLYCTNGFTKNIIPDIDIVPARGQIIVTNKVPNLSIKGIYHFDSGYYYFREIDGRILLGGGRNLDLKTEESDIIDSNDFIINDLKQKLHDIILPQIPIEIEMTWSGIMGFTACKNVLCEALDQHSFILAGFNGMGVALAPLMAQKMANMM